MAIRHRRGNYTDFDPSKMVAGEIAVVQSSDPNTGSGKAMYIAPTAGDVKRLAFVEDVDQRVYNLTDEIAQDINEQISDNVTAAQTAANQAAVSAQAAAESAQAFALAFTDSTNQGNIIITAEGSTTFNDATDDGNIVINTKSS